jgi:hypothetical protein
VPTSTPPPSNGTQGGRSNYQNLLAEPADHALGRSRGGRGSRGGRPPAFDRIDYRRRNVVERGFCDVEQWRGLATRYEKLALTFRGAAGLKAIVTWLHALACRRGRCSPEAEWRVRIPGISGQTRGRA